MADPTLDTRLGQAPQGVLDQKLYGDLERNLYERDAASKERTPSALELLRSPEGLIKLGLSAAALLSGNADAQEAGAGLAYGTLLGAPVQATKEYQDQQARIQQLTKTIEKQQQQLTQIMTTQPGMLVTDTGNGDVKDIVPPERMGVLSGLGIPVSPAMMLNRYSRDKKTEQQLGVYGDMFNQGVATQDEGAIRTAMRGMNNLLDLKLSEEQLGTFMQYGPTELPQAMISTLDPESVVQTFLKSHVLGKSIWDPEVNQLRAKKADETVESVDDMTALLVSRAMELAAFKWNELPADQRAYYTEHQEEFWEDVLVDEDAGPDGPAMVLAVKKAFPSARAGERQDEIRLEAMLNGVKDITEFMAIGAYSIKDPAERARFMYSYFQSVNENAKAADSVASTSAALRRVERMTQDELDEADPANATAPAPGRIGGLPGGIPTPLPEPDQE